MRHVCVLHWQGSRRSARSGKALSNLAGPALNEPGNSFHQRELRFASLAYFIPKNNERLHLVSLQHRPAVLAMRSEVQADPRPTGSRVKPNSKAQISSRTWWASLSLACKASRLLDLTDWVHPACIQEYAGKPRSQRLPRPARGVGHRFASFYSLRWSLQSAPYTSALTTGSVPRTNKGRTFETLGEFKGFHTLRAEAWPAHILIILDFPVVICLWCQFRFYG